MSTLPDVDYPLIDDAGEAWIVDWNWVGAGPAWVDLVGLLPMIGWQGVDVDRIIAMSPLTRGADPLGIDGFVACIAAYLMSGLDREPPPDCIPALRHISGSWRTCSCAAGTAGTPDDGRDGYGERMSDGLGRRLRRAVGRTLGIDDPPARVATPQSLGRDDGTQPSERDPARRRNAGVPPPSGTRTYPGDFHGTPAMAYAPKPDGQPDPGEIVWTWVPFEEDHAVGKDRPVLLIGSDGDWLLGVMLTSKDHDRDAGQEHRAGRDWVDVGTGAWDREGRPSEARINRIIRIDPTKVRREGSVLPEDRFTTVADAIRDHV